MSLISRLGRRFREKPKSTNLDLPTLPTPREMLEDIETCENNDPIISLANLIQRKGRLSLLDSDFLTDSTAASQPPHLDFLLPYQIGSSDETVAEDAQQSQRQMKRKGSITNSQPGNASKKASELEQLNNYNKLKQFLLVYEKSEQLLADMEPQFKRIEGALQSCEAYSNPNNLDVNSKELDECSSPLM